MDSASFFGKILPLAVWRFSRKPLWLELAIPICGFTFATGTYLTGVLKYLRRFAGRIAIKWLALLLAMPEKTRVFDACVLEMRGTRRKLIVGNEQRKAGMAVPPLSAIIHSRLPSLGAVRREWQKEKLACYLLATPLL